MKYSFMASKGSSPSSQNLDIYTYPGPTDPLPLPCRLYPDVKDSTLNNVANHGVWTTQNVSVRVHQTAN
jgi:hypothetical protein